MIKKSLRKGESRAACNAKMEWRPKTDLCAVKTDAGLRRQRLCVRRRGRAGRWSHRRHPRRAAPAVQLSSLYTAMDGFALERQAPPPVFFSFNKANSFFGFGFVLLSPFPFWRSFFHVTWALLFSQHFTTDGTARFLANRPSRAIH